MNVRYCAARAVGALSTWALRTIFRRPAANFPGDAGLRIDPQLIAHARSRIREGVVVVVGTNGKTTVTNMLADAFEAAGKTVACNRTGANLGSGVAAALLHARQADWAILESDELWLAKICGQLQPTYVVLLNLFRDQLDRMGEIDHVQQSIAAALQHSPQTTLIYNADDPLCQAIANASANNRVAFGIGEDMGLPQDTVVGAGVCQRCDSTLRYEWRQYGQLGKYRCPTCGFERPEPRYCAKGVHVDDGGVSLSVELGCGVQRVEAPLPGAYMAYNLLAVCAAADCCGLDYAQVNQAARSFAPDNGRLQPYLIAGGNVLLNLAKNPTGFNQNLRIVMEEPGPKAVAFFINDKAADGHDVSWLWDVDFQQLAKADDLIAYAGGLRRNDMQVRLKYGGVKAQLVDGAQDFLSKAWALKPDAKLFLIANYTALPQVKAELDRLAKEDAAACRSAAHANAAAPAPRAQAIGGAPAAAASDRLVICHMYPELLNLYGDGGNVAVLAFRAAQRGIQTQVVRVEHGQTADLEAADIVFVGGGPDREQRLASHCLLEQADDLRAYVEDGGALLAICGGFQIIGKEWLLGGEPVPGLALADFSTKRAEGGSHNRLVGNIVLESPVARMPVVGYENHAGRTYLGAGCTPFGRVVNKEGRGNNDTDGVDGVLYRAMLGTYLHGPLLAKNPEVADWLIGQALARRAAKEGRTAPVLPPLDDAEERAANEAMRARLR